MSRVIQQRELSEQLRRRASLSRLRTRVRLLESQCKDSDEELRQLLREGSRIREGTLTAMIELKSKANRISEARVEEILGQDSLDTLKENLGRSEYDDLQIFESLDD